MTLLPASPYVNTGYWHEYEWIVIAGSLAAFYMAWGIGANDVANSFGTSVGSKTLKLWQAVIIAATMEFTGAMALGGEVAKTVAGSIADPNVFKEFPELFMYGMLCALVSAGTWLVLATMMSFPVSTTHSIIGAIMGFALVWKGKDGVLWNQHQTAFPYSKGFVPVVCSWFVSPIASGIASAVLFFVNRLLILRRKRSTTYAFYALPPLVFITIFINLQFVLYKGAKAELAWSSSRAAWVAACAAAGAAFIAGVVGIPLMMRRHKQDLERAANPEPIEQKVAPADLEDVETAAQLNIRNETNTMKRAAMQSVESTKNIFRRIWRQIVLGLTYDVHHSLEDDDAVMKIHQGAEVFDPHTEQVYKYLQVFSACAVSFSHGANDVANAIGPLSAIFYVYRFQKVSGTVDAPKWIFALGGGGIVIGLATYGYNIIRALGVKMLKLTPARGFCAELATALTVSVASRYGLPISTTQIIVGGEIGVGLVDNWRNGINWPVLFKTFCGWVLTIIIAGLISAFLFAQGVYAPSLTNLYEVREYRDIIGNYTNSALTKIQAENNRWNASGAAWWTAPTVVQPMQLNGSRLNASITKVKADLKTLLDYSKNIAPVKLQTIWWYHEYTAQTYQNYTMISVAQNPPAIVDHTAQWQVPA